MDVDLCQNSLKWTLRVKHFTVCKFNLDLTLLLWTETLGRGGGWLAWRKAESICTSLEEWLQTLRWGRKCWKGVGICLNQGSDTSQNVVTHSCRSNESIPTTPHVVFSENSSSERIALYNNWGMQYGRADTSRAGCNLGRFVTLSSLLSIPEAQMFLTCCLAYCENGFIYCTSIKRWNPQTGSQARKSPFKSPFIYCRQPRTWSPRCLGPSFNCQLQGCLGISREAHIWVVCISPWAGLD